MSEFLPFSLPDIGEEEINEVVDSLRSNWLTTGPKTKRFEADFAAFVGGGAAEAIAVNSATAGLHLALEAAGVKEGDEVITTPYTFTATAEVVRYLGADPVFVDVEPLSLNIDPDKIEKAITARTKVIMPVHFAGLACDMKKILEIARRHNLKVIEDAAHALPATSGGTLIGAHASAAIVYSFYATKTITTGEGGMIVTRDKELAARCRTMRLHGINRDAFDRYRSSTASWRYEVVAPGYKYNMTDPAASLGIHQLKKAVKFHERRTAMALKYNEAFKNLPVQLPCMAPVGDTHSWHLYVIRLKDECLISRDKFIDLMAAKGIGCSVHFIPVHLHPYWRDRYNFKPESFPNANNGYTHAVSLPLYTKMTDADQERVILTVREILA